MIAKFTILGRPVRKSNNRIAVMSKGRPRIIKSKSAREFYESFVQQVPPEDKIGYEVLFLSLLIYTTLQCTVSLVLI